MLKFITDENFNRDLLNGLLRQKPSVDIVRVQDCGLLSADDPDILEWASQNERILFTLDVATMPAFLSERINAGKSSPGMVVVSQSTPVGQSIEELLLIIECSIPQDLENSVTYIPL
ncbi:DUF5615 family PIN-like protein [Chloroflexi bacterium TSY]|nr:DUF5615 family PIN-like protein [Chloroflexi bacterium TSY]